MFCISIHFSFHQQLVSKVVSITLAYFRFFFGVLKSVFEKKNDCSQKLIPLIDEKVAKIFCYFLENVSDVCCTNFSHNHKLNAVNSKIIGNKRAKFSIQRYKMQRSSCILFVAFFVFFCLPLPFPSLWHS